MTDPRRNDTRGSLDSSDPDKRRLEAEARKTRDTLKQEARHTGETLKNEARRSADEGKDKVADQAEDVSRAAKRSAEAFREEGRPEVGDAVASMADGMERFARKLRAKEFDELVEEGRRAARDNPMLFYGATAAAGFLAARLMTAKRPEHRDAERAGMATDDPMRSDPTTARTGLGAGSATDGSGLDSAARTSTRSSTTAASPLGTASRTSGRDSTMSAARPNRSGDNGGDPRMARQSDRYTQTDSKTDGGNR